MPLHGAARQSDFAACVETCVLTAGCTASRASVAGACVGALATDTAIPADWIRLTTHAEPTLALVNKLLDIRQEMAGAKL